MERIPCNPSPECKLYPRCYEDVHHIYKQADADTVTKKVFSNLDQNLRRNCRVYHMEDEAENGWPEYPSNDVMQKVIEESGVYLSCNKRKAIYGNNSREEPM